MKILSLDKKVSTKLWKSPEAGYRPDVLLKHRQKHLVAEAQYNDATDSLC